MIRNIKFILIIFFAYLGKSIEFNLFSLGNQESINKVNLLCTSKSPSLLNNIHLDINKFLIKEISEILPTADIISKKLLEWNSILINEIIDNRIIPEEYKKGIIINMVKFIEFGDNSGSNFLSFYKELIDCLLP